MPLSQFTLFLSVTFVVSASPGPVMLSCMAQGGRYGLKKAAEGMIGASLGNLLLMGLSALGIGLVLQENPLLMNAVKWIGAAYLVYLGIQMIRQPIIFSGEEAQTSTIASNRPLWLESFFIATSNPKGLLYFGALFPQFIAYDQSLGLQLLILTSVFLITDLFWMFIYASVGRTIMHWLETPKHQLLFNYFSGAILILVGCAMALTGNL